MPEKRGTPWTDEELDTILTEYACMLKHEQAGEKYSKAAHKRAGLLTVQRSAGSWEMKCCNISAALNDTGRQWIKGYKPLKGYQRCIVPMIEESAYFPKLSKESASA